MERKVNFFHLNEINDECLNKVNKIYMSFFQGILFNNINDLLLYHDLEDDLVLVLGEDWFLIFIKNEYNIEIEYWMAIDNPKVKYVQTVEMLNVFKKILLDNKDKVFIAFMIHNTSYKFYKLLKDKEYVFELEHIIDGKELNIVNKLKFNLINKFKGYDYLLNKIENEKLLKLEDLDYLWHDITFKITNDFVEKYGETRELVKH